MSPPPAAGPACWQNAPAARAAVPPPPGRDAWARGRRDAGLRAQRSAGPRHARPRHREQGAGHGRDHRNGGATPLRVRTGNAVYCGLRRSSGDDREGQRLATGHVAGGVPRGQRRAVAARREWATAEPAREGHRAPARRQAPGEGAGRGQSRATTQMAPRAGGGDAAPAGATPEASARDSDRHHPPLRQEEAEGRTAPDGADRGRSLPDGEAGAHHVDATERRAGPVRPRGRRRVPALARAPSPARAAGGRRRPVVVVAAAVAVAVAGWRTRPGRRGHRPDPPAAPSPPNG